MAKRKAKTKAYAKAGAAYNDKDAVKLYAVMQSIEKQQGGMPVKPDQLVEAARPRTSPIHHLFDWDTKRAAKRWLIHQARMHIAHLEIEIVVSKGTERMRAYHNVSIELTDDSKTRGYMSEGNVRASRETSDMVIAKAKRELESWKHRYVMYKRHFGVIYEALDAAGV